MDVLSINQKVYIRRSDGRVHLAEIIKLEGSKKNIVTVEWTDGELVRGKDVPLSVIVTYNPHIFGASCSNQAEPPQIKGNATASITPRPGCTKRLPIASNNIVSPRLTAGSTATPAVVSPPIRQQQAPTRQQQAPTRQQQPPPVPIKDEALRKVERLREQRDRRRQLHIQTRTQRQWYKDSDPGNPNWEVARMLRLHRVYMEMQPASSPVQRPLKEHQIMVCVRKRPLNQKELSKHEPDVISVPNRELLVVHELRKQVNLTKYLEHHNFRFDHTFDEKCTNAQIYERTAQPLVRHVFEGGMATCFAYGQTGSGKTHTMGGEFTGKQQNCRDGIYALAAGDVFTFLQKPSYAHLDLQVSCSFFEIYGTRVYDLLMSGKPELRVLEDAQQQVHVVGITEEPVTNTNEVLSLLELGNRVRTSGQTTANSKSSRSHAVFQIVLRTTGNQRLHGKFSLVDLAGNERGADNSSANRLTRLEGSEINKSLLALKECIRALGRQACHVPFRGSKLTQVLRDSFVGGKKVRTCMIAMISPGMHSVEHTLNTLRYADRVKELTPKPNPLTRAKTQPIRYVESLAIGRTSSLPDFPSQSRDLNLILSTGSLPESENPTNSNEAHSNWNSYHVGGALEDDNLAYFNEATDNYVQQPAGMTPKGKNKPATNRKS